MICVAHQNNSVDKEMFNRDDNKLEKYNGDKMEILKSIFQ